MFLLLRLSKFLQTLKLNVWSADLDYYVFFTIHIFTLRHFTGYLCFVRLKLLCKYHSNTLKIETQSMSSLHFVPSWTIGNHFSCWPEVKQRCQTHWYSFVRCMLLRDLKTVHLSINFPCLCCIITLTGDALPYNITNEVCITSVTYLRCLTYSSHFPPHLS